MVSEKWDDSVVMFRELWQVVVMVLASRRICMKR